jgi:hypothetical protein
VRILIEHLPGPQSYIAAGGRPIRTLFAIGLLSFNKRKTKSRITRRGRQRLAVALARHQ